MSSTDERLRIGTRGSPLALAQAHSTKELLERVHPGLVCELTIIRTTGDKDRVRSLVAMGGQGVFVKELENALLAGDVDLAVHSLKDVPSAMASGLQLAGYLPREKPFDTLITKGGIHWRDLPEEAKIGTGSPRRVLQLKALRSDVKCVDLRGNLDSRIARVDQGELDAIVLGCAGLNRLNLAQKIGHVFSPDEMVPAVAQGIVAWQARCDDHKVLKMLAAANDVSADLAAQVERGVMAALGGGCRVPMACLYRNEKLHLYLGDPASGRGRSWQTALSETAARAGAWKDWLTAIVAECRQEALPLPGDVGEHALMEFWGHPERLP